MTNGICPQCGETTVYLRRDNAGVYGVNTLPLGGSRLSPNIAQVDTYACSACGYFENYITDPKKRSYIAEHWEYIAPTTPETSLDANTRRLDR